MNAHGFWKKTKQKKKKKQKQKKKKKKKKNHTHKETYIKYYCFRRKVSLNSVFYDNGISFPFGMLQDLILGRNCVFFTMKHIEIRKKFYGISFPPLCQQKLLPVYVFTYMKVACWHKGGGR